MSDYTICNGDTNPALVATLKSNGTAIDLTGATVQLIVRFSSGNRLTKSCSITNEDGGVVSTTFGATELEPGQHRIQHRITFADTTTLTVPNGTEPDLLIVTERL